MKIALITDQHFGARNDSQIFLDYYEEFYSNVFFPKLEEEGIQTLFMLGDTFDRRKYINFNTLQRAQRMFFGGLEVSLVVFRVDPERFTNAHHLTIVDDPTSR